MYSMSKLSPSMAALFMISEMGYHEIPGRPERSRSSPVFYSSWVNIASGSTFGRPKPARFVPQAAWTPGSLLEQSHKHQWHKESPLSKSIWPKWRDTEKTLANLQRTGKSVFACDKAPNVSFIKHSMPVCRKGAHSKKIKTRLFI